MVLVGLTGGIGSGKSEVAGMLTRLGAIVVDADEVARSVVAPGTVGLAAVVAEFGDVLKPDGELDRPRLAALVFADAAARARLNAIVHPLVRQATAELVAAVPAGSVVVNDVPLLVESGLEDTFDVVVVVAASPQTQLARLVDRRGLAVEDARRRIAAQASLADKVAVADVVVDNDGDGAALRPQVEALWADLLRRAELSKLSERRPTVTP